MFHERFLSVPGTIQQPLDEMHLLIHPEEPHWTIVNDMGLRVFNLCDGERSLENIVQALAAKYGVEEKVVRKDVSTCIDRLNKAHFLLTDNDSKPHETQNDELQIATIHITNRCNLRCKHCYTNAGGTSPHMDTQNVINLLEQIRDLGGSRVNLTGGEPLTHPGLRKILEAASLNSLETTILSNGTLIDDEWAGVLSDSNVDIQVSLDAATAEIHDSIRGEGSFKLAVRGVELLQKKGLNVITCTTVMRPNLDELDNITEFVKGLGISRIRFIPFQKYGRGNHFSDELALSPEDIKPFYFRVFSSECSDGDGVKVSSGLSGLILRFSELGESARKMWCPIGKQLIISVDKKVYPCLLLMDDVFCLGDLRSTTLEKIFSSKKLKELKTSCEERRKRIEKCVTCNWKNFCQAGCAGLAYTHTGSMDKTDVFCDIRKEMYHKAITSIKNRAKTRKGQRLVHA